MASISVRHLFSRVASSSRIAGCGEKTDSRKAIRKNASDWTAHTLSGYTSAAFSRDGLLLALAGPDVKLLDSASGKELRIIDVPALTKGDLPGSADSPDASEKLPYGVGVSALAFSPDGVSLAVGYVEGTVRMMNLNR